MYPDAGKLSEYNNALPENKEAIQVSSSQKLPIVEKFSIGKKPRGQKGRSPMPKCAPSLQCEKYLNVQSSLVQRTSGSLLFAAVSEDRNGIQTSKHEQERVLREQECYPKYPNVKEKISKD